MHYRDPQFGSNSARDIFKGAIIGAAVAAAVAVLANKDTREKITKSVMDAISEMKKNMKQMGQDASNKVENKLDRATKKMDEATKRMDERFPAKEGNAEQP